MADHQSVDDVSMSMPAIQTKFLESSYRKLRVIFLDTLTNLLTTFIQTLKSVRQLSQIVRSMAIWPKFSHQIALVD